MRHGSHVRREAADAPDRVVDAASGNGAARNDADGSDTDDLLVAVADVDIDDDPPADAARAEATGTARGAARRRSGVWGALGILAELMLTLAALCGLYIAWQMWWTGVQSEHVQEQTRKSAAWSDPADTANLKVAAAQQGVPPVQPASARYGDLIAQIYIPRFGAQWNRNVVEGTDAVQLNRHGMGHYENSQFPGQVGNVAIAGHRNGYGEPLGNINKLETGDPIIIRTQDYWYIYRYTSHLIVLPNQGEVVAANPQDPGAAPTKRMVTLTTCEPRYATPTHRWIAYGELEYWARVSDGIPKELAATNDSGEVTFISKERPSLASRLPSLIPILVFTLIVYLVLFIAAATAWGWPVRRAIRAGRRQRPDISIYGTLLRLQPGVAPVRILLLLLLLIGAAAALLQWGYPWAASTIPYLREMSNYVTV